MKNNKASIILIGLGALFLLNAIFGRYLVLPGYLAGLETGGGTLEGASQVASPWKIARYLIWAYSFKLGIYFIILGAMIRTDMLSGRKWLIGVVGFVYIGFAYMPLPEPTSIIFGIAGGIMTLLMIYIFLRWANERNQLEEHQKTASDYRMAGYFFFAMATYTLCPLLGVKTFALAPEKMIQYGLQSEAASFAFHILIELVLGWSFIALSFRKEKEND
jgi:hypothetical protein